MSCQQNILTAVSPRSVHVSEWLNTLLLAFFFFHPWSECHSIFPACHHKNPAGSCRCCAAVAITPLAMCFSGYRRVLQGSWTEVKKKCSIAHCTLLSPKHPRGKTVGTKTLAAAGCLKYLSPLCRTPSFFLTRKQIYTTFCIQISKQRSLPLYRRAAGDPTHGKIAVLMLSHTMCLHHERFAGTHMLDNCIHSFAPGNRDLLWLRISEIF